MCPFYLLLLHEQSAWATKLLSQEVMLPYFSDVKGSKGHSYININIKRWRIVITLCYAHYQVNVQKSVGHGKIRAFIFVSRTLQLVAATHVLPEVSL